MSFSSRDIFIQIIINQKTVRHLGYVLYTCMLGPLSFKPSDQALGNLGNIVSYQWFSAKRLGCEKVLLPRKVLYYFNEFTNYLLS